MRFRVNAEHETIALDDPRDFRSFSIEIEGAFRNAAARAALMDRFAASEDGEHAWVRKSALRQWPGLADEQWWQEGLSKMIDAVRRFGWIDEANQTIRAHIEQKPAQQR